MDTVLPTLVRRADIIMTKDGLNPSRNKEVRKVIAAYDSLASNQVMQENVSQEKEVTLHWTSPEDKSGRKHGREEVASRPTIYSLQEWLSRIKYDITIAGPR